MLRPILSEPEVARVRTETISRTLDPARDPRLMSELGSLLEEHISLSCTDRAGKITFVNRAFCRLSGYTPAELIGQDHRILNSGQHAPDFFHDLWSTLSRGEVWRGEINNRSKNGESYWIAAIIAPITTGSAIAESYVSIGTDITSSKRQALAESEGQRALIARSEEELQQYGYVASHDLQEPLRAIVGCGQLLRQEYPAITADETARQLIDHMIEGGERMQRLVLALLAYSRVASRGSRRVRLSSHAALDQAVAELGQRIQDTGATIEAHDLPAVSSDPHQLVQLFQNLLDNAIKYHGPERPVIRVTAALEGDFWRFSVADNGIGIDRKHFDRIFVLFQRLHARGKYPGTGVGLSLCKKIVERHGGRIWVESEGSAGATFHFTLPAPGRALAQDV